MGIVRTRAAATRVAWNGDIYDAAHGGEQTACETSGGVLARLFCCGSWRLHGAAAT